MDLLPPRYAIESDDEDEFNPLHPNRSPDPEIKIKITGNVTQNVNLVIATGIAGNTWARGAKLGEQSGQVSVNGVQIGLVYNPPWTTSTIIVSAELPLDAIHLYAQSILDSLVPSSVSLLDSYPLPTYITPDPLPFHDAPIRYLSTSPQPLLLAELFAPPNLIQATSASFLSILSLKGIVATLILLPSPYIQSPPPKQISPPRLNQDQIKWSPALMKTVHHLLFQALCEPDHNVWEDVDPRQAKPTNHRTQVGEGGMYM